MLTSKWIGKRIAEARKKKNISQALLAQDLFISPQAVGKWERGESMPDIVMLHRLATLLGVDLNYFSESSLDGTTTVISSDALPEKPLSDQKDAQPKWDFSKGNWVDADFSGLKNLHEQFSSSNMQRCRFVGSDLSGLLLSGNNVDACDFTGSDFSGSRMQGSHLANNKLNKCILHKTECSGTYLNACDFTAADFTGFVIKSGGFEKNTLVDAVWNCTSFVDTYLADVVFEGSLTDCCFENCAFKRVTFHHATLTNTFFKNKRLKDVKFIDCVADRMTYELLKSGKADVSGIVLLTE